MASLHDSWYTAKGSSSMNSYKLLSGLVRYDDDLSRQEWNLIKINREQGKNTSNLFVIDCLLPFCEKSNVPLWILSCEPIIWQFNYISMCKLHRLLNCSFFVHSLFIIDWLSLSSFFHLLLIQPPPKLFMAWVYNTNS